MHIIKTTAFVSTLALAGCSSASSKVIETSTTLDSKEHKCLSEAIYYEAGSEPIAGLHAVGHVVMNRLRSSQYPKTICDVVYQRNYKSKGCQFGWTCRRRAAPVGVNWQRSQQVATAIIIGQSQDNTLGALGFDQKRYKKHGLKTVTIGNHTFWKNKAVANQKGTTK